MDYKQVTATAGLNMRSGPASSYAKKGALPYLAEFETDLQQAGWYHILRARNSDGSYALLSNGSPVDGADVWVSDAYVKDIPQPAWAVTVPPPDPDPTPDPTYPGTITGVEEWKDAAGVLLATYDVVKTKRG